MHDIKKSEDYNQQTEKSGKFKNDRKRCSYYSSNDHSNEESYQQKDGSKCKDSTTVDGKKSENHEVFVVGSTTAD